MSNFNHISVTWHGDVTSISGNAQHARALIEPLVRGGASVRLEPVRTGRPDHCPSQWWKDNLQALTMNPPGSVMIHHGAPNIGTPNPTGGPNIMFTQWETDEVPYHWRPLIEDFDELWVSNQECLKGAEMISKPKRVIRFPIDVEQYKRIPRKVEIVGAPPGAYIIGTTGVWNNRKNISDLIIAYLGEFSKLDRTCLVIKTNGANPNDPNERQKLTNLVREIKKSFNKPDMPAIALLQDIFSYEAMDNIIGSFDMFASASRGEGKNITLMKSIAFGTPSVFLHNHANADIVGACKSSLLRPCSTTSEPVMQMGSYYTAQDRWARPNVGQMMIEMKQIYMQSFYKDISEERKKARTKLARTFNPSQIVAQLVAYIEELQPFKVQTL